MKRVNELRAKRAGLVNEARGLLDRAQGEGRELSQEESNQFDALMAEGDKLQRSIEREERVALATVDLGGGEDEDGEPVTRRAAAGNQRSGESETEAAERAFSGYLRRGLMELPSAERRALQVDQDSQGGFLAPQVWLNQLIQAVDDEVVIRGLATLYSVAGGTSLGAPKLEADPDDATWTSELGTGSEDTAMRFGARELTPHPIAKRIKVSRTLLRKVPNAEAIVRARLAYKFGVTMEKAYLTGSGAGQPLGLFVASAQGISTGRDVSTGNTATAVTADGLIEAKYSLKTQYQRVASWMFHRDAVKQIVKLKDGEGQYLWLPSLRENEPDQLLGRPLYQSEFVPNTFTANKYVGMLGDYRWYWIADSLGFELQRLDELYSETNQVGMIGRWESDGMPVLEEAFVRVKLGS
jgi:HK97 family phage major capsid protein